MDSGLPSSIGDTRFSSKTHSTFGKQSPGGGHMFGSTTRQPLGDMSNQLNQRTSRLKLNPSPEILRDKSERSHTRGTLDPDDRQLKEFEGRGVNRYEKHTTRECNERLNLREHGEHRLSTVSAQPHLVLDRHTGLHTNYNQVQDNNAPHDGDYRTYHDTNTQPVIGDYNQVQDENAPPDGGKYIRPNTGLQRVTADYNQVQDENAPPDGGYHIHPNTGLQRMAADYTQVQDGNAPLDGDYRTHHDTGTQRVIAGMSRLILQPHSKNEDTQLHRYRSVYRDTCGGDRSGDENVQAVDGHRDRLELRHTRRALTTRDGHSEVHTHKRIRTSHTNIHSPPHPTATRRSEQYTIASIKSNRTREDTLKKSVKPGGAQMTHSHSAGTTYTTQKNKHTHRHNRIRRRRQNVGDRQKSTATQRKHVARTEPAQVKYHTGNYQYFDDSVVDFEAYFHEATSEASRIGLVISSTPHTSPHRQPKRSGRYTHTEHLSHAEVFPTLDLVQKHSDGTTRARRATNAEIYVSKLRSAENAGTTLRKSESEVNVGRQHSAIRGYDCQLDYQAHKAKTRCMGVCESEVEMRTDVQSHKLQPVNFGREMDGAAGNFNRSAGVVSRHGIESAVKMERHLRRIPGGDKCSRGVVRADGYSVALTQPMNSKAHNEAYQGARTGTMHFKAHKWKSNHPKLNDGCEGECTGCHQGQCEKSERRHLSQHHTSANRELTAQHHPIEYFQNGGSGVRRALTESSIHHSRPRSTTDKHKFSAVVPGMDQTKGSETHAWHEPDETRPTGPGDGKAKGGRLNLGMTPNNEPKTDRLSELISDGRHVLNPDTQLQNRKQPHTLVDITTANPPANPKHKATQPNNVYVASENTLPPPPPPPLSSTSDATNTGAVRFGDVQTKATGPALSEWLLQVKEWQNGVLSRLLAEEQNPKFSV